MKTILRYLLLAAAVGVCETPCWGQPPPRTEGKVLVLDTGRILEGDIELQGSQFRIRRSAGEVWIPAVPGMRLCADWKEAFAFMAGQTNRSDPDERVRLARWCLLHGLREQALAEVTAAVQMQPNHREARQTRDRLQRTLLMEKTNGPAAATPLPAPPAKMPALDISSDAVAMFTTRVQPILMNTCVSCHSGAQAGRFQLYRTYNGGQRAATLKNLAAVLPLINPDNPEVSPILIKAVSPHNPSASAQAPLKRESVPFYTLQSWVLQTLTSNPQLRAQRPSPANSPIVQTAHAETDKAAVKSGPNSTPVDPGKTEERPARENIATPAPAAIIPAPPTAAAGPALPGIPPPPVTEPRTSFADQTPSAPAEPTDPFDPVIFNRQTRP
jgi:hypothetical protein